jgi:hypothetical protein
VLCKFCGQPEAKASNRPISSGTVYDNERGKGDHRHVADKEEPYTFTTIEKLIDDFKTDVRRARGGP